MKIACGRVLRSKAGCLAVSGLGLAAWWLVWQAKGSADILGTSDYIFSLVDTGSSSSDGSSKREVLQQERQSETPPPGKVVDGSKAPATVPPAAAAVPQLAEDGREVAPIDAEGAAAAYRAICKRRGQIAAAAHGVLNGIRSVGRGDRLDFHKCAVVGNSGVLLSHNHGPRIDAADVVLRFNHAPRHRAVKQFVGLRDTIRVLNGDHADRMTNEIWFHQYMKHHVGLMSTIFLWQRLGAKRERSEHAFERAKQLIGRHVKLALGDRRIQDLSAEIMAELFHNDTWTPNKLSTEFFAAVLAMHMCQEVELFGFADSEASATAPPLYWEEEEEDEEEGGHSSAEQRKFWRILSTSNDTFTSDVAVIPGIHRLNCHFLQQPWLKLPLGSRDVMQRKGVLPPAPRRTTTTTTPLSTTSSSSIAPNPDSDHSHCNSSNSSGRDGSSLGNVSDSCAPIFVAGAAAVRETLCAYRPRLYEAARDVRSTIRREARRGSRLNTSWTLKECALVSNSGVMLFHRYGKQIDSADMVMRFNDAEMGGDLADQVGSRDDIRVLNGEQADFLQHSRTYGKYLLHGLSTPDTVFLWQRLGPMRERSLHALHQAVAMVPDAHLMLGDRRIQDLSNAIMHELFHGPKERKLTTGFFCIILALVMCHKVMLYGFVESNASKIAPYHYYGGMKTGTANDKYLHRTMDQEKHLWKLASTNGEESELSDISILQGVSELKCGQ